MSNSNAFLRVVTFAFTFAAFVGAQGIAGQYAQELNKLDGAHPQSVCEARDSLRTLLPKATLKNRASMFRSFRTFYLDAVGRTSPEFFKKMKPFSNDILAGLMKAEGPDPLSALLKSRPDIRNAGDEWFKCGFSVMEAEGDIYPDQNSATLLEFADRLPQDLESYIRFRAKEDAQLVIGDAAIMISWDQLRQRVARWETFARKYPRLPETLPEIQPEVQWLAVLYLFGSDNSPSFDGKTGQVEPKLLASWKRLVSEDGASRYHAFLTSLMAHLDASKPALTEQDRPLFQRVGLEEEFDSWWRNSRQQLADYKGKSLEY